LLRFTAVLLIFGAIAGLMTFGVIPTNAVGLARILLIGYIVLLAITATIGVARRG
jgi:uncharacterized membrane protein YtjA (UPF0391 family)